MCNPEPDGPWFAHNVQEEVEERDRQLAAKQEELQAAQEQAQQAVAAAKAEARPQDAPPLGSFST